MRRPTRQAAVQAVLLGIAMARLSKPKNQEPDFVDNIYREQEQVMESTMSLEFSFFFATCWVAMMGSVPLVLRWMVGKPLTRSQYVISSCMWLAIFGGLYLFCNVIIFQSPHFKENRTLHLVECIYMMAQVITTVGYGDITPAYARGQLFISFYVVASIFVITHIVSEVIDQIAERAAHTARAKAAKNALEHKVTSARYHSPEAKKQREHAALMLLKHTERPSISDFVTAVVVFFSLAFVWVLFFHYYPGEGKTWFQAFYFSIITLSTVGFGAFLPATPGGMVFAAFWMILGVAAMGNVASTFTEYMYHYAESQRFNHHETLDVLNNWAANHQGRGGITEAEFLQLALHQTGAVPDGEVELARQAFSALKDGNYVSFETLRMQCR